MSAAMVKDWLEATANLDRSPSINQSAATPGIPVKATGLPGVIALGLAGIGCNVSDHDHGLPRG